MPNQPKTPGRNIRIPDQLWCQLVTEAADSGTTPSHIVRELITQHLEDK